VHDVQRFEQSVDGKPEAATPERRPKCSTVKSDLMHRTRRTERAKTHEFAFVCGIESVREVRHRVTQ
jgi:hypothetical protein